MIGSCLMMGLKGPTLLKKEKDFIVSDHIAGVVLFKRNIESLEQLYSLCCEIKSLSRPSPLIAVDVEGGRVNRFSHLKEFIFFPPAKELQSLGSPKIFSLVQALGKQLSLLGVDINFAPVVDLPTVSSVFLKERILGSSQQEILKIAKPFVRGLISGGLAPCLKHFPGHGGVREDSHKVLPRDSRNLKALKSQLEIFQSLFKKYPCLIMTTHVAFPEIDNRPVTFSKILLQEILRKKLGFKGLVVSDDIDMQALKGFSAGKSFYYALKAGCDLIISCQKPGKPYHIIDYFHKNKEKKESIRQRLIQSSKKILKLRKVTNQALKPFHIFKKEFLKIQQGEI